MEKGGSPCESAWEVSLYSFNQRQMSSNDHFGVSTKNLKSLCEHTQKGALEKCTNSMIIDYIAHQCNVAVELFVIDQSILKTTSLLDSKVAVCTKPLSASFIV